MPGGVRGGATDTGGTAHEQGRRHHDPAKADPSATPRSGRPGVAGALGDGCPAYGRHVGGVSGGGGSGAVSPVSVTTTKVPSGSVTILRPRWVSQKKIGLCGGTMPP